MTPPECVHVRINVHVCGQVESSKVTRSGCIVGIVGADGHSPA